MDGSDECRGKDGNLASCQQIYTSYTDTIQGWKTPQRGRVEKKPSLVVIRGGYIVIFVQGVPSLVAPGASEGVPIFNSGGPQG